MFSFADVSQLERLLQTRVWVEVSVTGDDRPARHLFLVGQEFLQSAGLNSLTLTSFTSKTSGDPAIPPGDIIPDSIPLHGLPVGQLARDAEPFTASDEALGIVISTDKVAAVDLVYSWIEGAPFIVTRFKVRRIGLGHGISKAKER